MMDGEELSSWSNYHSAGPGQRIARDRVGAISETSTVLPGPPMTPTERRAASQSAPKTADGRTICWSYNSHMGCSDNDCSRAHEFYKNFGMLTHAVKICLVKRLGFKKHNKLSVAKVGEKVKELRHLAQAEALSHRAPPAARGDLDASNTPTLRVAGTNRASPTALANLDYLESEDVLRRAVHGGETLFVEQLPQHDDVTAGKHTDPIAAHSNDPKFADTLRLSSVLGKEPKLDFLNNCSPHLSSFVRAKITQSLRGKTHTIDEGLTSALECASTLGLPSLREEAVSVLENNIRVGSIK